MIIVSDLPSQTTSSKAVPTSRQSRLCSTPYIVAEMCRSLDLSFNNIRKAPTLPSLAKLQVLYLVQNKISRVEEGELDWAAETLTSIELGGNRLRAIENLEKLTKLEELWLGKNKIRALEVSRRERDGGGARLTGQNLGTFSSLRILSIQSNRLTKIEGLDGLVNLEELYLSHNGLKKLEGLEKNVSVSTECSWAGANALYRPSCGRWILGITRSRRLKTSRTCQSWRSSGYVRLHSLCGCRRG